MANRTAHTTALVGLLAATFLLTGCGLLGMAIPLAATKLQFGCIPEGSTVDTPEGSRPIETLRAGELVIGFAGEPVRILQVHEYAVDGQAAEFLAIEFTTGETVSVSGMHRIDGIPARDLHPGDTIAGRTVLMTTLWQGVSRSYDLLTEDDGYRIDGVPVNSMIEEMAAAR